MSQPQTSPAQVQLSGWGANIRSQSELAEPEVPAELLKRVKEKRVIARGLGRSYGDPALNSGGLVVGMRRLDRYLGFDPSTASLTCEAGVSLAQIIRDFGPRGFFPLISPGTKFVTIGGCIANDVHGKAHHALGSFVNSVDSMRVLLASGDVVTCSRSEHPDLFWGTFGGMGLLGIVLSATVRLMPVETAYYKESSHKAANLDELIQVLDETEQDYPYSVSSLDVFARGSHLGRGVANVGDVAKLSDLPPELARDPLKLQAEPKLSVPFTLPEFTLNSLSMRLVNAWIQHTQGNKGPITHYKDFTYPLDIAHDWYRAYGPRGFTQYQFVVPLQDGRESMRRSQGSRRNRRMPPT